jgi:hypothetical protein
MFLPLHARELLAKWRSMARAKQRFDVSVGVVSLLLALGGCTILVPVEVKPSDCINPPAGDCSGAANESRILEVRLYQLKEAVDPCQLELDTFAAGKELDALKSVLVDTQRSDTQRWVFKVTANEPRSLGNWEIQRGTQFVLAVAVGRGKGRNSARLISLKQMKGGWRFPTLYFKGYDICLDKPCDVNLEAQCHQ